MSDQIRITPNTYQLKLIPSLDGDAQPDEGNQFKVSVLNDSSHFSSFRLRLSAFNLRGDTSNLKSETPIKWYRVEPVICAKKPPGAEVEFKVVITRPPTPLYETTIDIELEVFSIEHPHLRATETLKLEIQKPDPAFRVELPTPHLQTAPGKEFKIPVLIYNYSAKAVDATVALKGENLENLALRNARGDKPPLPLQLASGYPTSVEFLGTVPADQVHQKLNFEITLLPDQASTSEQSNRPSPAEGTLEILPPGVVEFACNESLRQQTVPARWQVLLKRQVEVTYPLIFRHRGNHPIAIDTAVELKPELPGMVHPTMLTTPTIAPGKDHEPSLKIAVTRAWVGWSRQAQITLKPAIKKDGNQDISVIQAVPPELRLGLTVKPLVPGWLLLLVLLGLPLWWFWPRPQEVITSVRIDNLGNTVFSGSQDETVTRWRIDQWFGRPGSSYLRREQYLPNANQKNFGSSVEVIRLSPDQKEIAVGLKNGQIRRLATHPDTREPVILTAAGTNQSKANRVFDLVFAKTGDRLYSSHGSGHVYEWNWQDRQIQQEIRSIRPPVTFAISALAVYQPNTQPAWVIFAGQYNRLMLWDTATQGKATMIYHLPYEVNSTQNDQAAQFMPIVGESSYITTLAIAENVLVTGDNRGYVTAWNLPDLADLKQHCRPLKQPTLQFEVSGPGRSLKQIQAQHCQPAVLPIIHTWQNPSGQAIRSVSLSVDRDRLYLASAGDDGAVRVRAWDFKQKQLCNEMELGGAGMGWQSTKRLLKTVDLVTIKDHILVVSGDNQNHVTLYPQKLNFRCPP